MYTFRRGFHGDIVLEHNQDFFNLGYNYVAELPLVLWLHILSSEGENMFASFPEEKPYKLEISEEEIINQILRAPFRNRLTPPEFNEQIAICNIDSFCAGNNRTHYTWELRDDKKLYLDRVDKPVLSLDCRQDREFINDYLTFLDRDTQFSHLRGQTREVMRRLRTV
ncbi:MAG: hypothetical protein RL557_975 [archaeon]|jgi:hypothetical protein